MAGEEGSFGFGTLLSGGADAAQAAGGMAAPGGVPGGGFFAGGGGVLGQLMQTLANPEAMQGLLHKLTMSGVAPPPIPQVAGAPSLGGPEVPMMPTTPVVQPPAVNQLLPSVGAAPPPEILPGVPTPPEIPVGPNPLQRTVDGLNSPSAYPTSVAGGVGDESPKTPGLGQLLAGAQTALKPFQNNPGQPAQRAPSVGAAQSYGSTNLAKAPGYLPQQDKREQARKSLGELLGRR